MKKILYFILCITTMFVLVSCKKNEPVGRETANFISDFKLGSSDDYSEYDAIIKDMQHANRVSNFNTLKRKLEFDFTANKKVVIKKISFRLYNHSETETLKILVNEDISYNTTLEDTCIINGFNDASCDAKELKPNEYKDITLSFENLMLKKNTLVMLMFGFTADPSYYDFNPENSSVENMKQTMDRLNNCGGICNFKIDYIAYMKV